MRQTVLLDIDGTLVYHQKNLHNMMDKFDVIPGTIEKFLEWRSKDYYIILTTARPEGIRSCLEKQLHSAGLFYDQLIMGLPTGCRTVINDRKPSGLNTAKAICLDRDLGIKDITL